MRVEVPALEAGKPEVRIAGQSTSPAVVLTVRATIGLPRPPTEGRP